MELSIREDVIFVRGPREWLRIVKDNAKVLCARNLEHASFGIQKRDHLSSELVMKLHNAPETRDDLIEYFFEWFGFVSEHWDCEEVITAHGQPSGIAA